MSLTFWYSPLPFHRATNNTDIVFITDFMGALFTALRCHDDIIQLRKSCSLSWQTTHYQLQSLMEYHDWDIENVFRKWLKNHFWDRLSQNPIFSWRGQTAALKSKVRNNTGKYGQADRSALTMSVEYLHFKLVGDEIMPQTIRKLRQVWFSGAAKDFSPRVNFQCRLSYSVYTSQRETARINICAQVKDLVLHVMSSADYGNTKTPSTHRRLGSTTLSQLAFSRESNLNFQREPSGTNTCGKKKSLHWPAWGSVH